MNAGKASPAAPVSLGMINSPEKRSVAWPEKLDNTPETTFPMRIRKTDILGERLLYVMRRHVHERRHAGAGQIKVMVRRCGISNERLIVNLRT